MTITLEALDRVHCKVKRIITRGGFDTESIAMDILLESWVNGHDRPAHSFIKNRCLDIVRSTRREQQAMKNKPQGPSDYDATDERDAQSRVGELVKVLDNLERKVIFYRFYADLPLAQISQRMGIDVNRIRQTLEVAIYKMREAGYGTQHE